MFNKSASGKSTLKLDESLFINNSARRARGGAVYASGSGIRLKINGVVFLNNSAAQMGGAIAAIDAKRATITAAMFNKNKASQGGAVFWEVI